MKLNFYRFTYHANSYLENMSVMVACRHLDARLAVRKFSTFENVACMHFLAREDTHFICHVRCTSDDCPPRTDHFGVHDGHVHVCRRSISLVVMQRI